MTIKKIGLRILLVLAGIIALAIALVLLVIMLIMSLGKIRYKIFARVGDNNTAHIQISYFLWLVRIAVDYSDNNLETKGRIAWVKLGKRKSNPPKPSRATHKATASTTATSTTAKSPHPVGEKKENIEPAPKPVQAKKEEKQAKKKEKSEKKDTFGFIKQSWAFMSENEIKKIIKLVFICFGKMFKALRPKHVDISGIVGFDDPATTGWVMGAYEAAVGVSGLRPYIQIQGSYHEKALALDVDMHGRTSLGRLIWVFVWLIFQKPVRRLIRKQISGRA